MVARGGIESQAVRPVILRFYVLDTNLGVQDGVQVRKNNTSGPWFDSFPT